MSYKGKKQFLSPATRLETEACPRQGYMNVVTTYRH